VVDVCCLLGYDSYAWVSFDNEMLKAGSKMLKVLCQQDH
jgi:hypothetical protein